MNNIISGNMSNNNQPVISNLSNCSLNANCNNLVMPNSSTTSMITNLSENAFENIIKNIKAENFPLVPEISELDDVTEIVATSVNDKNEIDQQEDNIPMPKGIPIPLNEITSNSEKTFNEKDLNVSRSYLENFENINLFSNRKVKDLDASSHLSTYQIPKIISNTSHLKQMTHNCNKCCVWCSKAFAIFDNPNHIGRIRNIEKQNAFLKIELSLKLDSCLCDRCFKFLEKTYKFNETEKRKGIRLESMDFVDISPNIINKLTNVPPDISTNIYNVPSTSNLSIKQVGIQINNEPSVKNVNKYSNVDRQNIYLKRTRSSKKKPHIDTCCVHKCSKYSMHQIFIDECTKIKELFSIFDFTNVVLIQRIKGNSDQPKWPSLTLCGDHLRIIDLITTCQLCYNKVYENLNPENWKMYDQWNKKLFCYNIPLILQPGMFICTTCQNYMSGNISLSTTDLEQLQLNVMRRYDLRRKVFGKLQHNISNTCQTSNANTPQVIARMIKRENLTKVQFADPLITSLHYFRPEDNEHLFQKKKRKSNCPYLEMKLKINKSDPLIKDNLLQTVKENLNYDSNTNNTKQISNTEESSNSVTFDSLLSDIEKENSQTMSKRNCENISNNNLYMNNKRKPNNRIIRLMGLLNKEANIVSTIKQEYDEDNSQENIIENAVDCISNYTQSNFTNMNRHESRSNQNIGTVCLDVEEDMLPTHVSSILNNNQNNVSEHVITDKYTSVTTSLNSNQNVCKSKYVESDESLPVITSCYQTASDDKEDIETNQYISVATSLYSNQSRYEVEDIETDENELLINSVYSNQNVCEVENVENDQNELMITSIYSQQNVCNVNEDKNSMDFNKKNQNTNIEDMLVDEVIYLDESDSGHTVTVKPRNIRADPVEIRKKLRNVVCQRISKEDVKKKQKVNETLKINDNSLYENVKNINSKRFIKDNIVKLYTNRIFNQYSNSDSSDTHNVSYDEVETLMTNENYCTKDDIPINGSKTNKQKIHIESTYSLGPNVVGPLRFYRTLKKIPNLCDEENSFQNNESSIDDNLSDYRVILDNENISFDETMSNCEVISDDEIINNGEVVSDDEIINNGEVISDDEIINNDEVISDDEIINNNEVISDDEIINNDEVISDDEIINNNEVISDDEIINNGEVVSDDEIINNAEIMSDDEIINNGNNVLTDSENVSDDTQEQDKTRYYQFPQAIELTNNENNDNSFEINFELNDSLRDIYENLLIRFNNDHSEVFNYLMENERMLYIKELVLSENANTYVSSYLEKHLKFLSRVYGNPNYNKANTSYLHSSPASVREYSQRSFPLETNDINTSKSLTTTTTTLTTPTSVAPSQMITFSSVTEKKTKTINQSSVDLQSSTATVKCLTVGQPKPNVRQPIFQLPTAVRSKGMQFIQSKPSTMSLRPNLTNIIIRNTFNNNKL